MRLTSDRPSSHSDALLATRRLPPGVSGAIIAAALGLVFALDHSTAAVPLQHLYCVPIILAGVRFGFSGSTLAATIAVLLYHLANPYLLTFRYGELDLVADRALHRGGVHLGEAASAGTLSIRVGIACGSAGRLAARDRRAADAAGAELFRAADAALYTS